MFLPCRDGLPNVLISKSGWTGQYMAKKTQHKESVVISQIMQPHDANPIGNIHGGVIMNYIDNAAAVVATRHAKTVTVTASIDRLDFFHPVSVGDLLVLKASLNWVGKTSMEIGVRVEAENMLTSTIKHIASSYLIFVALDKKGNPCKIPPMNISGKDMKRRCHEAMARRNARLLEKEKEKACQADSSKCTF